MSDRIRTIRRRKGDKKQEPAETPSASEAQQEAAPAEPAPKTPKKRLPTGPKIDAKALQAEADALGPDAMATLMGESAPSDPEAGQQVSGTIASITGHTIFVNIGAKSEAMLETASLSDPDQLKVGDAISAYVLSADARGIRLAPEDVRLWRARNARRSSQQPDSHRGSGCVPEPGWIQCRSVRRASLLPRFTDRKISRQRPGCPRRPNSAVHRHRM